MVLMSNLVTMQTRVGHHAPRDDSEYVELPLATTGHHANGQYRDHVRSSRNNGTINTQSTNNRYQSQPVVQNHQGHGRDRNSKCNSINGLPTHKSSEPDTVIKSRTFHHERLFYQPSISSNVEEQTKSHHNDHRHRHHHSSRSSTSPSLEHPPHLRKGTSLLYQPTQSPLPSPLLRSVTFPTSRNNGDVMAERQALSQHSTTRSSTQQDNGHRSDLTLTRKDDSLTHTHNTPLSPVNQRETTHLDHSVWDTHYPNTPYHYNPSTLIDVGDRQTQAAIKTSSHDLVNGESNDVETRSRHASDQNGRNSLRRQKPDNASGSSRHKDTSDHSTDSSSLSSRLSAVPDLSMSSIASADSWSPSYIKMDFFMSNGDSAPKLKPVPRDSNGLPSSSNSSRHLWKAEPKNGYKSPPVSKSFDSLLTQRNSSICENGIISRDSSQETVHTSSRSDKSSTGDRHDYLEEMTTHHARLFTVNPSLEIRNSENETGSSPVINTVPGTLPHRVKSQFLRRSVSHEPGTVEVKPPVIRTSSDGEIESEYVTLDHSYIPLNNSGLCKVNEIVVDASSKPASQSLTVLPTTATNKQTVPNGPLTKGNDSSDNKIKRIHNPVFTNQDSNVRSECMLSQTLPANLVKNSKSRSMRQNLLKTNSFPDSHYRWPLKSKSNTGNLCTVVENDVAASTSINLHETFSTLPRTRRSVIESRSSTLHSHGSNSNNRRANGRAEQRVSQHATPDPQPKLIRSKSLPDLQVNENEDDNSPGSNNNNYSDDEDGDDFGFLSYPISFSSSSSCSSSVMHKAKSPSPTSRILPKRWRTKAKAVPGVASCAAMWTPGPLGSCVWSSVSGRKVQLRPESILSLSEAERIALQKVAFSKLQEIALDCPLVIPKDATDVRRSKKSALSLKRRSKSMNVSSNDSTGKDASGMVFGIPITKCIKNDKELERKNWKMAAATASAAASPAVKIRTEWVENSTAPRSTRKSSSSSQGSLDNSGSTHNGAVAVHRQDTLTVPSYKRAASSDSLSESESSRNTSSSLIDALSLSATYPASRLSSIMADRSFMANQGELQVPNLVNSCFKHIQTYGLQTLGIFRVGCSKKRVKQLREEFDTGKDVELKEEHHPHDVGALLKEYFRDLPEPLLTRELYLPFLHAKRLTNEHKRSTAIQLLISMLPVANRDTLWALLQFLATVSQHATDSVNEKGEQVPGNKMDSHNLATLFGPNILHRTKSSTDKEHTMESAESVEQSKEVIEVVKEMIECHHDLYEISGSVRDDVLRLIIESDQETVDKILKQLANQNQIEADPESMCSVFEDSTGSPVLSHAMNSDADFFAYAKRQTSASQRPLRVTKSVEDNLDSPLSKARATHFSDSYAHDLKIPSSNTHPCIHQDMVTGYPSPTPTRIPILQLPQESSADIEVVLRGRMELGNSERPYSENYSQNLSIPRPIYLRESSNSSVSSCLSSSLNSHGGSDGNNHSGHWVLPTPPASRGGSPKPLVRSASSSSTLIASPPSVKLNHSHSEDYCDKNHIKGTPEWEKERWRHWEMMASEKRNIEAEQETLV